MIPAGHLPDVEEAKARFELLRTLGPTPDAFTFKKVFQPPDGGVAEPYGRGAELAWIEPPWIGQGCAGGD